MRGDAHVRFGRGSAETGRPQGRNRAADLPHNVKIREGQVANRPVYLALGVTVDGERDVLGLWAGEHGNGEGAKFWLRVLSEIKNRGTRDVCMLVCDGLKGLPDAVNAVWEKTIVQTGPAVRSGIQARDVWFVMAGPGGCHRD